jgi:P27 family predicted phage terminase small subunit
MKRGRKKSEDGTIPARSPSVAPKEIEVPSHLEDSAKPIFARIAKALDAMKVLSEGDIDAIAFYAEVAALGRKHKQIIDDKGATQRFFSGSTGLSPDYVVWRDCLKTAQKLLNDLGLTPASRHRVSAVVAEEADEFALFMAKRGQSHGDEKTPDG